MRLFTRIHETRSLSQTARDLGTTQPTVSKGLQALEDSLGARLFERNTRGLRPTDAGALYYEQCKRWLAEMEEVHEHLSSSRKGPRGRLKISFPVNLGQVELARIAFAFQRQNPSVQLDISLSNRRVDLVEEGFDMAVRLGRVDSPTLVVRKLAHYHPILVAAPSYLHRHGSPSTLAELMTHRILYTNTRDESVRHRGQSHRVPRDQELVLDDPLTLLEAIREGIAIGLLSPWLVHRDTECGALVPLLPDVTGEEFDINAVFLPSRSLPTKIRAFLALCAAEIPLIPGLSPPDAPTSSPPASRGPRLMHLSAKRDR
ncbi:MAG TPA: LysR family transcriptional regulator [Polyangiaceae bacterium]